MYVTLSGYKQFATIESNDEDGLLITLISGASNIIDRITGRTFGADTISSKDFRKTPYDTPFYKDVLVLDEDLADDATFITGTPSVYYLPINGPPYHTLVLETGEGYWDTSETITISGYWGYSKNPPEEIQIATLRLTEWLYELRQTSRGTAVVVTPEGQVLLPQGLPNDILTILEPFRKLRGA